jgi:hypothetical protein
MTKKALLFLTVAVFSSFGCGTTFNGDAHFPGGIPNCQTRCAKDGLSMAAYVYLGEFTTGCVCSAAKPSEGQPTAPSAQVDGVAAAQAVAVAYQRRNQDSAAAAIVLGAANVATTLALTADSSSP